MNWPVIKTVLSDPEAQSTGADHEFASAVFRDFLENEADEPSVPVANRGGHHRSRGFSIPGLIRFLE